MRLSEAYANGAPGSFECHPPLGALDSKHLLLPKDFFSLSSTGSTYSTFHSQSSSINDLPHGFEPPKKYGGWLSCPLTESASCTTGWWNASEQDACRLLQSYQVCMLEKKT